MKCVRVVGQGVPVRLPNDDAFQLVERDKDGEYCSKSFWKRWYDDSGSVRLVCKINHQGRIVSYA